MTDRLKGKRIMNVWHSFECHQTSQVTTTTVLSAILWL
jgi:hypothetical protein